MCAGAEIGGGGGAQMGGDVGGCSCERGGVREQDSDINCVLFLDTDNNRSVLWELLFAARRRKIVEPSLKATANGPAHLELASSRQVKSL